MDSPGKLLHPHRWTLRSLVRSPTFYSVVIHSASGFGFVAANLILARVLPAREYALFTLGLALLNMGHAIAPAGIDGVVLRRDLDCGPRLLGRVLTATSIVALSVGVIGALGYGLSHGLVAIVILGSASGGAMYVAGARFQREHRFGLSLALIHSSNLVILLAAVLVAATGTTRAWVPLLLTTIGFVVPAIGGWTLLFRERDTAPGTDGRFPWKEAFHIAAMNGSMLLLVQLDRLVIPHVLPLEDLATYGVLAAIVGSLFRVLQMGVAFSLLPRLAAASGVAERRRLIAAEARLVTAAILVGSVGIWLVTPLVETWVLADKYDLPASLILASIAAGVAKSLNAFSTATTTALADQRELRLVNLCGWASVAVSILVAALAARWGLAGVIYGVGLGWLLRAVTGLAITARHLRMPAGDPDPAPKRVTISG